MELDLVALIGLLVRAIGNAFEVAADSQKSHFAVDPQNRGRFIQTGRCGWSRHPNYLGEIVLWIRAPIIAPPVLRGWQWVTLISPVFVAPLLTRVGAVPILEKRSDAKWGGQEDHEAHKKRTPPRIPRPWFSSRR